MDPYRLLHLLHSGTLPSCSLLLFVHSLLQSDICFIFETPPKQFTRISSIRPDQTGRKCRKCRGRVISKALKHSHNKLSLPGALVRGIGAPLSNPGRRGTRSGFRVPKGGMDHPTLIYPRCVVVTQSAQQRSTRTSTCEQLILVKPKTHALRSHDRYPSVPPLVLTQSYTRGSRSFAEGPESLKSLLRVQQRLSESPQNATQKPR